MAETVVRNVVANFFGKAWVGIIQIVLTPIYIKLLGIESYALIGFFITLQTLISTLDLGLSATTTRELARWSSKAEPGYPADLLRTFEIVYWIVAIVIAIAVYVLAPTISTTWLNAKDLPTQTISDSVALMGFVIACQWPYAAYSGGLVGLQEQVRLNMFRATVATVQGLGAVVVLVWVSTTIEAYFVWQSMVLFTQTMLSRWLLLSRMPAVHAKPRFRPRLLRQNLGFAGGMAGISVLSIVLTQADKILVSNLLSLEEFGLYMLAFTLGTALQYLVMPFTAALFPKFTQLVAGKDVTQLAHLYHRGTRALAAVILPAGVVLVFFPSAALTLWLGDPNLSGKIDTILSIIALGAVVNALVAIPYAMQLAHGWTSLSIWKNIIALFVLVPAMIWLIQLHGLLGAAMVWLVLNLAYYFFEMPIMHRRILKAEIRSWYLIDTALPLASCVGLAYFMSTVLSGAGTRIQAFINLGLSWALLTIVSVVFFTAVGRREKDRIHAAIH